jgi:hypothetical protein
MQETPASLVVCSTDSRERVEVAMRRAVLLMILSLGTGVLSADAVETRPATTTVASVPLHSNVVTLIGLMGLRDKLMSNRHTMAQEGRQELLNRFPNYNPAFADEWARRMEDMMPVDEYVNIVVSVYERNYTNDDVVEMIQYQQGLKAARTPLLSARLQAKISNVTVAVQSEIVGGFSELGARRGGEIGQELAKEHPEWLARAAMPAFEVKPAN